MNIKIIFTNFVSLLLIILTYINYININKNDFKYKKNFISIMNTFDLIDKLILYIFILYLTLHLLLSI